MTDQSISKKDKKYISDLQSGNQQTISTTLDVIQEEGNITLIPTLIDLLHTSDDEQIKKKVYSLLSELKLTGSVPFIIEAIKNGHYSSIQEELIRICWENGLDYTPYLSTFVDITINGSFMNAFEAFTVIENMEGTLPEALVDELISLLEAAVTKTTLEKKELLYDLIKILPSLK